ncbi:MAG: ferredoxin [Elusimicrobiales bacterium]|nr:ferredoxin [Elusimicrobiales bacterium]
MKAAVDAGLCIGCGLCVNDCPDVFEMQGDKAVVKVNPVPKSAEDSCKVASQNCPVQAIKCE